MWLHGIVVLAGDFAGRVEACGCCGQGSVGIASSSLSADPAAGPATDLRHDGDDLRRVDLDCWRLNVVGNPHTGGRVFCLIQRLGDDHRHRLPKEVDSIIL
jgi:hypothetical protein